ncbi:MAG: glycosyltransferase [Candidatus Micrarchaeota archaeon]
MSYVSVVVPIYNESECIAPFVSRIAKELSGLDYEIIIAEDGSDDAPGVIRGIGAKSCRVLHSDIRLGRGAALTRAIKDAKSDIVLYMDADLASEPGKTKRLIEGIENGAAVSTGSRLISGSNIRRGFTRSFMSRGFNLLVRFLLGSRIFDHQCGFKGFRRSAVLPLLKGVKATHWFWDTELLVRAQWARLKVDEFPIEWKEGKGTKVRLFKDTLAMASGVIRLAIFR